MDDGSFPGKPFNSNIGNPRRTVLDAPSRLLSLTLLAESFYYLVTGLWPLVNLPAFIAVTGPKTDLWLVHTVALLITIIGAAMCTAALKRRVTPEIMLMAVGVPIGLTLIDVVNVIEGVIPPVYLLDAAAEMLILGFWYYAWRNAKMAARVLSQQPVSSPPVPPTMPSLDAGEADGMIRH